jgi:uncharacterized protein
MAADVLLDTGALLALLDTSDVWHSYCREALKQLRVPLLTSEAVLTELFHFIGDHRARMDAAWKLIRSGGVALGSIEDSELDAVRALMSRYCDLPMDFADATLVYLAQRESIQTILTVDQNDFSVYRIAGKRRFRILPVERP